MADITLTCGACGASLTISEYAKPDNLTCLKCGKTIVMPGTVKESSERLLPEHVRQAKADAQAQKEARGDQEDVHLTDISKSIHVRRHRSVRTELIVPTLKAMVLFIILTATLGYIRFFEGYQLFLPAEELSTVQVGGFFAVLFFHVVIVVEAMTYNFTTGLLCLVVPGYSLYYLFTTSDSFWLRAIMLSVVIVFGYDFYVNAHEFAVSFVNFVNNWLETGGTPEPLDR
jgi:hypothetical protein